MRRLIPSWCRSLAIVALASALPPAVAAEPNGIVVYQSDFGLKDGAVSAMHGVARGVDADLILEDLTHEIPAFDIWNGAYMLFQTVPYWPEGTVFVSVVDPGVGSERKSVVAELTSGHYVVTPDNGTLTLLADSIGIEAVHEIDENVGRRPGSSASFTFHGRDVYSFTAAQLASAAVAFEAIGPALDPASLVTIEYQEPEIEGRTVSGNIPILDIQYGNVWTNIPQAMLEELGVAKDDRLAVTIAEDGETRFEGEIPYVYTFSDVPEGDPLVYINSIGNVALALNYDDFAATHGIGSGADWRITLSK